MDLLERATTNAKDILEVNYRVVNSNKIFIIYDRECGLSILIKDAFEKACILLGNEFELIDFYSYEDKYDLLVEKLNKEASKEDIAVLIQSSSFRVSKYRWRNELCDRGLKVVEFGHLDKMNNEAEIERFVNSITCDYEHYEKISNKLMSMIEKSKSIKVVSGDGSVLLYSGKMDKCLRNTGSLWEQTNWTTRFPIGEVISEALDLSTLNGEMMIYSFPNIEEQRTVFCEPFKCKIEDGLVVSHEGGEDFEKLYEMIKTENEEGDVFVREFGLGLNRHIKRYDMISDSMAYERQEGLHFSLGMKHGMYQKKLWPKYGKKFYQRYHIDVYVDVNEIFIDDTLVYTKDKGYF
ncbi:MAG: hypothetical protein KC550_02090 [Nanoarchaeota archaeon]|nr:hypothetical protein [Nanoarchaeota archaeon]